MWALILYSSYLTVLENQCLFYFEKKGNDVMEELVKQYKKSLKKIKKSKETAEEEELKIYSEMI